jgi:hypothetical protein
MRIKHLTDGTFTNEGTKRGAGMTRDEILKLAAEAKLSIETPKWGYCEHYHFSGFEHVFKRFAALVAAHEREACLNCYSPDDTATDWADKIRARGQE